MKKIISPIKLTLVLSFMFLTSYNILYAGENNKIENSIIAGPEDAPVTIEEFSDFECPYCRKGSQTIHEVLKNYNGKVNLIFRHLLIPGHANSPIAAKAFIAVSLQSPQLAYEYQRMIFANQEDFVKKGENYLYSIAEKLGLNINQLKIDMESEIVKKTIENDMELAKKYNFQGTPSFKIGNDKIIGAYPYEEFKKIIDKQLGI